jgi:Icc-related predicted phosphoesterase
MRLKPKRNAAKTVKLFFATDIHGSEQCFRKWLNAPAAYATDVLILGGDITGKTMVPIVADGGTWEAHVFGTTERAGTEEELAELQKRIHRRGLYDIVVTPEEKSDMDSDPTQLRRTFAGVIAGSLRRWLSLAESRLGADGRCYVMLGNDDDPELAEILRSSESVIYSEDRVVELPGGYQMISFGYSTPTPWDTPREMSEEAIAEQLERLALEAGDPARTIFNVHCPPRATHLDQAPELDGSLRPVNTAGGTSVVSVGSQAVRDAIERFQPLLGLHGHVHECSAGVRLGRTLCINPGSDYGSGSLRGAIVELNGEDEVRRWQLTQG